MKKARLFLVVLSFFAGGIANAQSPSSNANQPLLAELSQLQTQVLSDIVQKKTDRLEKHLHTDVSFIPFQGMKLNKQAFVGFVQNKDFVFESITPSDFQLGYSDAKVAVLTYKETVKISGQPQAMTPIVTVVYVKENGLWKAIVVHATLTQG